MKKIAVVVVTFNRKELLMNCLNALFSQEYIPTAIYIIDNNSSDGTYEALQDDGFLQHDVIQMYYINTGKNLGGAGGFYLGLKTAHESGLYDAYLLMDDDGIPDKNEIKELVPYLGKYDYINALVVNNNDERKTSFKISKKIGNDREKTEALKNGEGVILNYANPFNGTLISKEIVNRIGYPKPEMFIYGDEIEYLNRAKKYKFVPVTVVNAIHRHPCAKNVSSYCNILGVKIPYSINNNSLLTYCRFRNQIYNISTFRDFIKLLLVDIVSLYFYNKKSKLGAKIVLSAIWAGVRHDFTGHLKYVSN